MTAIDRVTRQSSSSGRSSSTTVKCSRRSFFSLQQANMEFKKIKMGNSWSISGSDRVPVGGMQEMTFKISKLKVKENNIYINFNLFKLNLCVELKFCLMKRKCCNVESKSYNGFKFTKRTRNIYNAFSECSENQLLF